MSDPTKQVEFEGIIYSLDPANQHFEVSPEELKRLAGDEVYEAEYEFRNPDDDDEDWNSQNPAYLDEDYGNPDAPYRVSLEDILAKMGFEEGDKVRIRLEVIRLEND